MRIAFLGDGSLNHVRRWAGYFDEKGHEILLVSFEEMPECPFPTVRLPRRLPTRLAGYLLSLPKLKKTISRFRPDLLNALYIAGYGFIGSLAGVRPLVVSALGSDLLVDYPSNPIHRRQIGYALKRADLVTTDAEILSRAALSAGAGEDRLLEAFFGIDDSLFFPPSGGEFFPGASPARIVSTRNLYPVYNIDLLVDAAPIILEKIDARFVICGDGPLKKKIEEKVTRMGLAPVFCFPGKQSPEGIASILREGSVYVSVSRSDSTSVSLLEAMACGVPPVVTDIPANREWIKDGENGFLVPPDSPRALADAVVKTALDRETSGGFSRINIELVRKKGLWKENMERVERAFQDLVDRR